MWVCSGSQLRPNRWRDRECEQKVSNMEELIVLLIVSLQFFCLVSCQFWPAADSAMCTVQDGLFTKDCPECIRICFRKTDSHEWIHCAQFASHCCDVSSHEKYVFLIIHLRSNTLHINLKTMQLLSYHLESFKLFSDVAQLYQCCRIVCIHPYIQYLLAVTVLLVGMETQQILIFFFAYTY